MPKNKKQCRVPASSLSASSSSGAPQRQAPQGTLPYYPPPSPHPQFGSFNCNLCEREYRPSSPIWYRQECTLSDSAFRYYYVYMCQQCGFKRLSEGLASDTQVQLHVLRCHLCLKTAVTLNCMRCLHWLCYECGSDLQKLAQHCANCHVMLQ